MHRDASTSVLSMPRRRCRVHLYGDRKKDKRSRKVNRIFLATTSHLTRAAICWIFNAESEKRRKDVRTSIEEPKLMC
jgi:hypothetical protein